LYEQARDRLVEGFYRIVRQLDLESDAPETLLDLDAIAERVSAGPEVGHGQHPPVSSASGSRNPDTRTRGQGK
jgi:hypothetical protein